MVVIGTCFIPMALEAMQAVEIGDVSIGVDHQLAGMGLQARLQPLGGFDRRRAQ